MANMVEEVKNRELLSPASHLDDCEAPVESSILPETIEKLPPLVERVLVSFVGFLAANAVENLESRHLYVADIILIGDAWNEFTAYKAISSSSIEEGIGHADSALIGDFLELIGSITTETAAMKSWERFFRTVSANTFIKMMCSFAEFANEYAASL